MTSITHGMDLAEVRRIAKELSRNAGDIQQAGREIDRIVNTVASHWKGPDSVRFAALWRNGSRARLSEFSSALMDLAKSAEANARQQEETSLTLDGDAGPGVPDGAATPPDRISGAPESHTPEPKVGDSGASPTPGGATAPFDESRGQQEFDTRSTSDGGDLARGGENEGQCTAWAYFRRKQLGLQTPRGNGGVMAASLGPTTQDPSVGAVASGTSRKWGHVMIVEAVKEGPPRSIVISEMNGGSGVPGQPSYVTTEHGVVKSRTLVEESPGVWIRPDGFRWTINFSTK
ncbi:MAG TPA: CHAP domain-containing protein [Arachnia sp.]|nr:CHAP domain-containing protein [Arachnia sp.]